jgi:hypothetical protein
MHSEACQHYWSSTGHVTKLVTDWSVTKLVTDWSLTGHVTKLVTDWSCDIIIILLLFLQKQNLTKC